MADFLKHTMKSKSTKPSTSQVSDRGVSEAKSGGPGKMKPDATSDIPPGGSPMPKKGSGGTENFASWKKQAATPITTSAISAAK